MSLCMCINWLPVEIRTETPNHHIHTHTHYNNNLRCIFSFAHMIHMAYNGSPWENGSKQKWMTWLVVTSHGPTTYNFCVHKLQCDRFDQICLSLYFVFFLFSFLFAFWFTYSSSYVRWTREQVMPMAKMKKENCVMRYLVAWNCAQIHIVIVFSILFFLSHDYTVAVATGATSDNSSTSNIDVWSVNSEHRMSSSLLALPLLLLIIMILMKRMNIPKHYPCDGLSFLIAFNRSHYNYCCVRRTSSYSFDSSLAITPMLIIHISIFATLLPSEGESIGRKWKWQYTHAHTARVARKMEIRMQSGSAAYEAAQQ